MRFGIDLVVQLDVEVDVRVSPVTTGVVVGCGNWLETHS